MVRFFVRNLPWTISRRELKEYFSQFGRVSKTIVAFDKNNGFSKGFGFISFEDDRVRSAILGSQHVLEGNKLTVAEQDPEK